MMATPPLARGAVRPPAVAGRFYPDQPQRLLAEVQAHLAAARLPDLPGAARAVIAPHAGFSYSGPIAAYSFQALPDPGGRILFLLGPAHFVAAPGVAVATFAALQTPLGRVEVAQEVVEQLLAAGAGFIAHNAAHLPEHSLEVELPFLQARASAPFQVAPLLFGADADPAAVAAALTPLLLRRPDALLVVSSDLSHYHPYAQAQRRDRAFLNAVIRGDVAVAAQGEACGLLPILTLMHLARRLDWQPRLLDYRNSGDTAGGRDQVVGYAAVAFFAASPL